VEVRLLSELKEMWKSIEELSSFFFRNGEDTIIQRECSFFWYILFVTMEEVNDRLNEIKDIFL